MKKGILLLLLIFPIFTFSQDKILFSFDDSGNQVSRTLCISCLSSKNTAEVIKKIEDLKEENLQKFFPEDVISFYPNPVEEQLFLKWDLINETKVSEIQLHTLNGQLLKIISDLENSKTQTIQFQSYPNGVYILLLIYTNGEQKSIKIIKE